MESFRRARSLRSDVATLLGSLGSTPEEVAERLGDEGVAGTPRSGSQCAVAVYLRAVVGADPAVRTLRVTDTEVEVLRRGMLAFPVRVALPSPVRAFVASFDRGRYPQLERPRLPQRRAGSEPSTWSDHLIS